MISEIFVFFRRFCSEPHAGYTAVLVFFDSHHPEAVVGIGGETCPSNYGERRYCAFISLRITLVAVALHYFIAGLSDTNDTEVEILIKEVDIDAVGKFRYAVAKVNLVLVVDSSAVVDIDIDYVAGHGGCLKYAVPGSFPCVYLGLVLEKCLRLDDSRLLPYALRQHVYLAA